MKRVAKRLLAMGLTFTMMCGAFAGSSLGAKAAENVPAEGGKVVLDDYQVESELFAENEELFAGYVENLFYKDLYEDAAAFGNIAALKLQGESKAYYDSMKKIMSEIAEGKRQSTEVVMDVTFTWTAEELGVDKITYANYIDLAVEKYTQSIDINKIWTCLLADCPYDMYWYDKAESASGYFFALPASDGKSVKVFNITMSLPVAEEYRDTSVAADKQMYTFNTGMLETVQNAKANAQAIVEKYKNFSKYEKLNAYQQEICDLVSYNDNAADDENTPYGNPWQLIWVFDGDESTKVVCEGYSKAFQYLCDLSEITCYSVSGDLSWDYGALGRGAGPHMWNVVPFDGQNYLVDVTNIEHLGDFLFMAGTSYGSAKAGYDFVYEQSGMKSVYTYKYAQTANNNQLEFYGEEILTLAQQNLDPSVSTETTPVTEVFSDISEGAWYVNAVQYVYDKGTMSGNDGLFNPDKNVTRAQVVTTLYRLSGSPAVTDYRACGEMVDVKAGEWYTDAVCWAYNVGVATGNSDTKMFNMNNPVTRQQLAAFLYRFVEYKGLDHSETADLSSLINADKVADYAKIPVKWSVGAGIISGKQSVDQTGATVYDLAPEATATRAQLATMLQRLCEKYHI